MRSYKDFNDSFKTVIFDFDGTLLDTSLIDSLKYLKKGKKRFTREWAEAEKEIISHYKDCHCYDGIQQLMNYIRENKIRACIVTGNGSSRVYEAVKQHGWQDIIPRSRVFGCYSTGLKNEKGRSVRVSKEGGNPSLFNHALDVLGVSPSKCIEFGDNLFDTESANNAGIEAFNCAWGASEEVKGIMRKDYRLSTLEHPLEAIEHLKLAS